MNNVYAPRILISATGSGKGKTTISTGILSLLKRRGLDVHAFKCGPDYIDPMYHEAVLGLKSSNLDPFFCDDELLKSSFCDSVGEINIIEGCMGLFDGLGTTSEASSYSVAASLNTPIVLLVDAYGMGYSVVAMIKGFLAMDEKHLIKGVFLNRISKAYFDRISPVIENETGVSVIGFLPTQPESFFESRHLGLKSVSENNAFEKIEHIADIIDVSLDVDKLIKIANSAEALKDVKLLSNYVSADGTDKVIAVARDDAFCFYYRDNIKALELAGARVVYFSPMNDSHLPEGYTGIYLGGGYPELFLDKLNANEAIRTEIFNAIEAGIPVIAECGGYMYLQDKICGVSMVGVFDDSAENQNRSVRFGYVTGSYGNYELKGHEFHHYDVSDPGDAFEMTKASTGDKYNAVHVYNNCIAGFPHFYYLSCPDFVREFFVNGD